jgi:hypothetical protein
MAERRRVRLQFHARRSFVDSDLDPAVQPRGIASPGPHRVERASRIGKGGVRRSRPLPLTEERAGSACCSDPAVQPRAVDKLRRVRQDEARASGSREPFSEPRQGIVRDGDLESVGTHQSSGLGRLTRRSRLARRGSCGGQRSWRPCARAARPASRGRTSQEGSCREDDQEQQSSVTHGVSSSVDGVRGVDVISREGALPRRVVVERRISQFSALRMAVHQGPARVSRHPVAMTPGIRRALRACSRLRFRSEGP